ncbi:hypothetical protein NP233_g12922 [Leucocoprinus birnbaumii]|uniref:Nephrocystin 3-like N-terminal domain-containing protein n=1 Tax=Leucocoprinus birnbaumii TaxID=56174 RepID=A0AAD5VDS0_9AGAR|nr:hypothetical protein NP233_g12922 [Leucocoprinus birnbaumii]
MTHPPCYYLTLRTIACLITHIDLVFNDAHFINNAQIHNVAPIGPGIEKLLENAMPDAFHDSLTRYPPPKCHLGTRKEYIKQITDWALGESEYKEPVLWMRGPFGVGKTAVAQSSAEDLKSINKLLATLFFSRSSTDRDDPRRVIPSLVYQITTLCKQFAAIIDARIREDPALTTKSLATQFEELLVAPLRRLGASARSDLEGRVIIIDGLDECRGIPEQCEIIRIIATSAQDSTTPFRWFITSRPEDPIIRTMKSASVSSFVHGIELPVSRSIDHEILLFLVDEFTKIREGHGLSDSWPSEEVLNLLVDHGAGLWIYISTIVRFIKDENSLGPEDQLQIVLKFIGSVSNKVEPNNPLQEMDFFYTLILQRIPSKILEVVRRIVFLHLLAYPVLGIVIVLGLSEEQLRRYCVFIQSVMELRGSSGKLFTPEFSRDDLQLHFYYASFIDYLTSLQRSGDMCIRGEFLIRWQKEVLEWLHSVYAHTTESSHFVFPPGTTLPKEMASGEHYTLVVRIFWKLFAQPDHQIDVLTAASIAKLPFKKMLRLIPEGEYTFIPSLDAELLGKNLPNEFRDKIIRREKCPTSGCMATEPVWILGYGDNEVVVTTDDDVGLDDGGLEFKNNENLPVGECPCGARIRGVEIAD